MKKRERITSHLEPDIIYEILLKVPLKSLVRFKSVSKQWCNQIIDSVFARAHLLKHQEVTSFIIHINEEPNPRISIVDMKETEEAKSRGELLKPLNIPLPTKHFVRFQNCCDGILCAFSRTSRRILLWNPITKWTKEIDYPPRRNYFSKDYVGFGYGSSIEDYKVVRISSMHIEVMNLKSSIWRTVSNDNPGCVCAPVHCNGLLYWKKEIWASSMIIGFDLEEEKLRIVQRAPKEMKNGRLYVLTCFQGMLCLIQPYTNNGCDIWHEIWVMKEESNWVKVFDVKPKSIRYIPMCGIHEAVVFRIFFYGGLHFILTDRENGESYTSIKTSVTNETNYWYINTGYVGSLISPPS